MQENRNSARQTAGSHLRECLIGAGVSGIGIARVLAQNPLLTVDLYDRQCGVGGVWRQNKFEDLGLQTSARQYTFPDDPWPTVIRGHPTAQQVILYLQHIVQKHQLTVHSGVNIVSVKQHENGLELFLSHGSAEHRRYDLVIQTSESTVPHIPCQHTSALSYTFCHSSELEGALLDQIVAKFEHVVICGGGKSAYEIVHSFAKRKKMVTWVCRQLYHVYAPDDHRIWKQALHPSSNFFSQGNRLDKSAQECSIGMYSVLQAHY